MRTIIGRAIAILLSFSLPVALNATAREAESFETCRGQAQCRLLSHSELDRLRGGFSFLSASGPLEIRFGITQMAFINDQLVAYTQLVLPESGLALGSLTASARQLQGLSSAVQSELATLPGFSAAKKVIGTTGQSVASKAPGTSGSVLPVKVAQTSAQVIPPAPTSVVTSEPPVARVQPSTPTQVAPASASVIPPAPTSVVTSQAPVASVQPSTPTQAPPVSTHVIPPAPTSVATSQAPVVRVQPSAPTPAPANAQVAQAPTAIAAASSLPSTAPSVASAVSPPSKAAGSAAPTVAANGNPTAVGSPLVSAPNAAGVGPLIIQSGPGNVTIPSAAGIRAATMGLVIQNTLNNQTIRTMTVLNVSATVRQAISAMAIQDTIRQAMANAVH